MNIFRKLKNISQPKQALEDIPELDLEAALLPESKPPTKLKPGVRVVSKYLGTAKGVKISNPALNTTNLDRGSFSRNAANLNEVIKNLVLTSPDLSYAVAAKLAMAITNKYTAIAYDETGRIDTKGTEVAQALCQKFDTQSYDYTKYTKSTDLRTTSAMLLLDSLRYGCMGGELVLDKGRLPSFIKPFPMQDIEWADDNPSTYPIFKGKDGDVPLNFPTIFTSTSAQDTTTPYASSPLQTAIQASLHDIEFVDTLRKAATKNLLQRLRLTIDGEKWKTSLPVDVQYDAEKLEVARQQTLTDLENQLNSLSAEDALVIWDSLEVSTIADANRSEDRSIKVLSELISGQVSAGAKILPSIIGRGDESSVASTESMLFVKALTHIQDELNIFYSRVLTLAVRLLGQECSVRFKYQEASLRPEIETASFRAVEQSMKLEQLSLGLITDEECSIKLTGTLPPTGFTPLAGTMFKNTPVDTKQNDYSNTSATTEGKTNDTSSGKNIKSNAPTGVKGKNPK